MQILKQINQTIQQDTIIEKNYNETIFVPKGRTLTIEGQINRLICVDGGTVIIKGITNRINGFNGIIIIEQNGYCDSLYCGLNSKIFNKGKIHQIYILKDTELILEPNSTVIDLYNDNSKVTIKQDSYIKNYKQWGDKASCNLTGKGDRTIQKMDIHCGGKNE